MAFCRHRSHVIGPLLILLIFLIIAYLKNIGLVVTVKVVAKVASRVLTVNPHSVFSNATSCSVCRVAGLQFPICTYSAAEDPIVSAVMLRGDYWEVQLVVANMLRLNSFANTANKPLFIDIGANIGAYSLAIAHFGYKVVSVEPNWQTMRLLATSVVRGNISDRVTLLQNAVSNEHSTLNFAVDAGNRGNSYLLPATHNCTQNPKPCRQLVQTIKLDDLLIVLGQDKRMVRQQVVMKVDAQGSEMKIFDPTTSSGFFQYFDVVAIQMEWEFMASEFSKDPVQRAAVDRVLEFLNGLNFVAYPTYPATSISIPLGSDWSRWPLDILMIRKRLT